MLVPIVDSRGVTVRTCTPVVARHMIQDGEALPRRSVDGSFYIQLVPALDLRRRKARQLHHPTRPLTRRARRAQHAQRQNYLLSVLADRACLAHQGDSPHGDLSAMQGLDRLLVIDVESTCWLSAPPEGERAEIIEIGLCLVDVQSGARLERESILIRPERSTLSPFCTQLTTLTSEHLANGVSFAEACDRLRDRYRVSEVPWASYGEYDRRMFETQCADWGIAYPFSAAHVNVKHLVSLVRGLQHEVGLIDAMRLFDLPVEGTHHRGVDDAWNTALIATTLILQRRAELAWGARESSRLSGADREST